MQFLDRTGVGTLWSICKEKFALTGHTHNYAGSGSPGGSANSAIGVVDYNQTGKTIQIGYSGTGITGDQIKYIAGYTNGSGNVNAKIKDVSKDALKSWLGLGSLAYSSSIDWSLISRVPTATTTQSGIMSAADKSKLNGIASGANNYSLPVASATTLGGIKASTAKQIGAKWPIFVDSDGLAYTCIYGLNNNSKNNIVSNLVCTSNEYLTSYTPTEINMISKKLSNSTKIIYPKRSGTLALISDVSNSCRFNFVNSVAECKSNRINFLIFNEGYTINIDPLNDCVDGTILLIFTKVDVYIKNESKKWYHLENFIKIGENFILRSGKLFLITVIEGAVHAFSIY